MTNYQIKHLSNNDFKSLTEIIYNECGINIIDNKKTMLETRLQRRLKHLGLSSYAEYCAYLFTSEGMDKQLVYMIDAVTTNKTDFFREPGHFDYLVRFVLPEFVKTSGNRRFTVWSAGCSSGEEPYTLAMVLKNFSESLPGDGLSFTIIATDISTDILEKARLGVYQEERVIPVPHELKKKYLLKGKDKSRGLVRVCPELRTLVKFMRLNLMDNNLGFRNQIDVIFCRNVIIYFDKRTQERLLNKLHDCLSPQGYIFMGHSETLFGMDVPLTQVAPTIYQRLG
jgi:chemotaxis protein methyltransferase CheR